MQCRIVNADDKVTYMNPNVEEIDDKLVISLRKEEIPDDCRYIDFCPDFLVSGIDSRG